MTFFTAQYATDGYFKILFIDAEGQLILLRNVHATAGIIPSLHRQLIYVAPPAKIDMICQMTCCDRAECP